jgi:hypothetical protein
MKTIKINLVLSTQLSLANGLSRGSEAFVEVHEAAQNDIVSTNKPKPKTETTQ